MTDLQRFRHFSSAGGATQRAQFLSNGRYAVMVTAVGSGYSRWQDLAVTRWRDDATCDNTGSYILLRDVESGERWSAGFQPSGVAPDQYDVSFADDRAEFVRRDGALVTRLEIVVSPEDDAEIRRVCVTNSDARIREIEVTSYAEVVLAPPATDAEHPAFSNLFIQTEYLPERDTLLANRRRRTPDDTEIWLAHVLAVDGETVGDLQWETDRAQFIGRGRTIRTPLAESEGRTLSNSAGAVLDPIISLRRRVRVRPGQTVRLTFSTIVASTRNEALGLGDKYRDLSTFQRVATLARTRGKIQLHDLGIETDEAQLFQTLAANIVFPNQALRASAEVQARRTEGVGALWAHGVSGDLPIILVEVDNAENLGIVRQVLRAHGYWRLKRLAVDLVILNTSAPSSRQDPEALIKTLVLASQPTPKPEGSDAHGKVCTLRADQLTAAQRDALESVARVLLSSGRGSLAEQIAHADNAERVVVEAKRPIATSTVPRSAIDAIRPTLEFDNGLGGFDADGSEYVTVLRDGAWTPAPWINVIANPDFGCLVSEAGSGTTWSVNSQENLLTPWSNDPVSDPPSDMLYIRDEDSGELWSPTPLPIREQGVEYVVRHGHGYSRFTLDVRGVALDLLQFVPASDPVKVSRLTLTNNSPNPRRLSVTAYLEWALGALRSKSAPFVVTEMDQATGAMFARNSWNADFGTRIAFADLGGLQTSFTGDRADFLGRNGALDWPAALARGEPLSGLTGAGLDPCCAMQTMLEIPAGGSAVVVFLIGEAETRDAARALIGQYRTTDLDARLQEVTDGWAKVLGTIQVKTPDRSFDLMLNQWLLYQTLACRVWARTAFYQASGAWGFRDQLQDVMALAVARPDITRAQVLKAASRQFVEGDVQHWWHEPVGRGVRTRISDDLLWLPYVASQYLEVTGDQDLLSATIPFLDGPVLAAGQTDAYFEPKISAEQGTLFEHCARAIDRSLPVGVHGLPLMGAGDWNDGMNRVGMHGKGESVWLAWFLHAVLTSWAPIAKARGETTRAAAWTEHAEALAATVDRNAWDGDWYRRAYFDDGTPLGTAGADACAIDAIAQAWAVISGAADPARAARAMASVDRLLVRRGDKIILLLTPPFNQTALDPGYIKAYVPGVRENGAQYTHAAVWSVIAFALLGDGTKAAELFAMLNPITHAHTPQGVQQYRVEPYVTVGDVCSDAPNAGRGGWSWYTGSAGWLYRAGVEWMLGIRVRGARLMIDPCIPAAWPGFSVTLHYHSARYDVTVVNPGGVCRGIASISLDDVALDNLSGVPLVDDHGAHSVQVVMATSVNASTANRS
ncbi:MAG: glycosyl hydrolase family 65 protein [Dokdonella sp.]